MTVNPEKMAEKEERSLHAEIEALRREFSDTQELYREVCALLFFRHGVTPTANRLYQLVRKGSMSAPAAALSAFWETLREKSRVRIEHPDLPEELRTLAGEAVASLWQRARTMADANLESIRRESLAARAEAEEAAKVAAEKVMTLEQTLVGTREERHAGEIRERALEQDLARGQGVRAALESRLEQDAAAACELRQTTAAAKQDFERRLAEQKEASAVTESHLRAESHRLQQELARERKEADRCRIELERGKQSVAKQAGQQLTRTAKLESELEKVRQKLSSTELMLSEAKADRDRLRTLWEGTVGVSGKANRGQPNGAERKKVSRRKNTKG